MKETIGLGFTTLFLGSFLTIVAYGASTAFLSFGVLFTLVGLLTIALPVFTQQRQPQDNPAYPATPDDANFSWNPIEGTQPVRLTIEGNYREIELSDYCVADHSEAYRTRIIEHKRTPLEILRRLMLLADQKSHFVGIRGKVWQLLGIHRSDRNPNLCNI
jgi:hypothetical protein